MRTFNLAKPVPVYVSDNKLLPAYILGGALNWEHLLRTLVNYTLM
jgi:hypothetical protein